MRMGIRSDVATNSHMFSTKQADNANYATAGISLVILLVRILIGRWRRRPIDVAFYLVLLSIVSITARITLNWYQLRFGTVNDSVGDPNYFQTHNPADVVMGSKMLLGARASLTCSLWLQSCLLLLFYWRILRGKVWVKIMIKATWVLTGISFIVVTLFTFLECRPFHLYWQIHPDPGRCTKGYEQLLSQCVGNILIDIMLLAISLPILLHRSRSAAQYCQIGTLYLLGTLCTVVTVMRLTAVLDQNGQQAARTLWGAVQIITSTFVANVPTIYGDMNIMIRKKKDLKRRRSSRPESWTRTSIDEGVGLEADVNQDIGQKSNDLEEVEPETETQPVTTIPEVLLDSCNRPSREQQQGMQLHSNP